jgi:hypothetical protein
VLQTGPETNKKVSDMHCNVVQDLTCCCLSSWGSTSPLESIDNKPGKFIPPPTDQMNTT